MDYQNLLSAAAKEMRPSGIRKFFDIAAEMDDCISLGVGEPDFKTPWAIRDAGITSLEKGRTWYTSNAGLKPLRAEICTYLARRFDLHYDLTETLVTVGGSEAIDVMIRAVVNPGDEVLIPEPCYVSYQPITTLTGGVPVSIPLCADNDFKLTAAALKAAITPKTKLLIMPFPCNPTGAVMRREDLEPIAAVLRDTNIFVLSDEIYAELTYGSERHVSIASLDGMKERTLLVNGFSKAYAMTGWRLGYACGPVPLIKIMTKIHQSAIMCAPTTSQYAAVTALKSCDSDIESMRIEYDMRRRLLVRALNEMGLT
ncbi:MAG: aminotransferase class I/II-fold pyridoxal phosphate-dependent enzyme, partial [Ruthenibacterium sp.]